MTNNSTSPKFTVRYTLGLFLVANWVYNTLVTGSDDSLADFSKLSSDVFNDQMFYAGAFNQLQGLMADLDEPKVMKEMLEAKTFLLQKKPLIQMKNMSEEGMKKMMEEGHSIYSLLFGKKLAENIMFEEDLAPMSYSCIDGSDKAATDEAVPLPMVFSVDGTTLNDVSRLLDFEDTTIVDEVITKFMSDDKLKCYAATFNFMKIVEQMQ